MALSADFNRNPNRVRRHGYSEVTAAKKSPAFVGGARGKEMSFFQGATMSAASKRGPRFLLRARGEGLEHRSDRFEQEARVFFGALIEENLDHREYAGDRRRGGRKELMGEIGIVLAVNINIGPDDLFLLRPPFRDGGEDGIGGARRRALAPGGLPIGFERARSSLALGLVGDGASDSPRGRGLAFSSRPRGRGPFLLISPYEASSMPNGSGRARLEHCRPRP